MGNVIVPKLYISRMTYHCEGLYVHEVPADYRTGQVSPFCLPAWSHWVQRLATANSLNNA